MITWLIGMVTGMIYDFIGIAARLKPEDEARSLKARQANAATVPSVAAITNITQGSEGVMP